MEAHPKTHPAPSESPERAAEILLLLVAHDARAAAPEEVVPIAGSYTWTSGGGTETGEAVTGYEPQTTREEQSYLRALARYNSTWLDGPEGVTEADGIADALDEKKPRQARLPTIITEAPNIYIPSPSSASTTASTIATSELARLEHLAYIDTFMIPHCPLKRSRLARIQTFYANHAKLKLGRVWYLVPDARRVMLDWLLEQAWIEDVSFEDWEDVCYFEDDEDDFYAGDDGDDEDDEDDEDDDFYSEDGEDEDVTAGSYEMPACRRCGGCAS